MCNHCNLYENCLFCSSRACLQVEGFSVDSPLWRGLIKSRSCHDFQSHCLLQHWQSQKRTLKQQFSYG
ncbi:unnamed protein product [Acanthoscelides obtectus]|uniref:Uncharacterized protein n=1 Tax=Acanthoscelides obtectus TaxID=200917 RepID=A0A9P0JWN5_ACAOB|nr:unnamed protein product [Acanthoscelides obtectus]CAK1653039.1 hypothetical protein AOBTE_LOCUS18027 [Acanthoscelides obtectus]